MSFISNNLFNLDNIINLNNGVKNPVDQTIKHSKLSDNYKFVSTQELITTIESKGLTYLEESTSAVKPRDIARIGYTKHLLQFSTGFKVGDSELRLLVTNSHDGTSSVQFNIGIFRFACANGLVAGDSFYKERFIHNSNQVERMLESLERLPETLERVAKAVTLMQSTNIIQHDKYKLCNKLVELRGFKGKVSFLDILQPMRVEDTDTNSLWTIYNIVQEKMERGGYIEQFPAKQRKVRAIKSINTKLKLNKELFDFAYSLANEVA